MKNHFRKYGDKESHPIPVWNGLLEKKHFKKIGAALWVYEWLLDRITEETNGEGILLGGRPIKASEIASTYGMDERTVRTHIDRLKRGGYILVKHAPYGLLVTVLNSMKFGIWKPSNRSDINARPVPERSEEIPGEVGRKNPRGRAILSDVIKTQQTQHKHAAAARLPACEFWNLIGVSAREVPPAFRELCEGLYPTRNGQPLSAFMGTCMDAWAGMGEKRYPRVFAKAKARIVAAEKEKAPAKGEPKLAYLPPMPPITCKS